MKGTYSRFISLISTGLLASLLVSTIVLPAQAQPITQGPNSPGTAVDDPSIGTSTWTISPSNAVQFSDDTYATASLSGSTETHYLKVSSFGFSIPSAAVIDGIEVAVEKLATSANKFDNAVRIVKGGAIRLSDKSSGTQWPTPADGVVTYGGSSDLWGETWTAADINASGFGFAISAKDGGLAAVGVDQITITVYYSLCGDGTVSPGEQCDDSNTTNGDCCSSTCQFEPSSVVCRPAAGECDLAENCTGASGTCPADAVKANAVVCRAATTGGDCDEAEVCDGVSTACPADGFLASSTVCRGAAGECDLAENCTGSGPFCPGDTKKNNGTGCTDDGNVCTLDECNGSSVTCQHPAKTNGTPCPDGLYCNGAETCVSGTCQSGTPPCVLLCDEGSDQCVTGCPAVSSSCRTAQKSILTVKDKTDNTKDRLTWKWLRGKNTTLADFGDPTTTTGADYALCIYAGTTGAQVGEAIVPASSTKWKQGGTTRYIYTDVTPTEDGIKKIVLKSGADGKAKAIVRGKGDGLPDLLLPLGDPVKVQLFNGDNGLCWGASYTGAQLLKNQLGLLKAKAQ